MGIKMAKVEKKADSKTAAAKQKQSGKATKKQRGPLGGRNEWNHHFGSKGEVIDSVILGSKEGLSTAEIQAAAEKLCMKAGLGECGMVRTSAHLQHCRRNGFIEKASNGGWVAVGAKKAAKKRGK